MSFLFDDKMRKTMKWVWGGFAILIIISMIALYAPGIFTPSPTQNTPPVSVR